MAFKSSGHHQILTTIKPGTDDDSNYVTPWLPYGGSNRLCLFYNSQGYDWMVGRCKIKLNISQVHYTQFDFWCSRYGGGIYNRQSGSYLDIYFKGSINGNINHNGFIWRNSNTNTWGNGSLHMYVEAWGGGLASGKYGNTWDETNYTTGTATDDDKPFMRRLN